MDEEKQKPTNKGKSPIKRKDSSKSPRKTFSKPAAGRRSPKSSSRDDASRISGSSRASAAKSDFGALCPRSVPAGSERGVQKVPPIRIQRDRTREDETYAIAVSAPFAAASRGSSYSMASSGTPVSHNLAEIPSAHEISQRNQRERSKPFSGDLKMMCDQHEDRMECATDKSSANNTRPELIGPKDSVKNRGHAPVKHKLWREQYVREQAGELSNPSEADSSTILRDLLSGDPREDVRPGRRVSLDANSPTRQSSLPENAAESNEGDVETPSNQSDHSITNAEPALSGSIKTVKNGFFVSPTETTSTQSTSTFSPVSAPSGMVAKVSVIKYAGRILPSATSSAVVGERASVPSTSSDTGSLNSTSVAAPEGLMDYTCTPPAPTPQEPLAIAAEDEAMEQSQMEAAPEPPILEQVQLLFSSYGLQRLWKEDVVRPPVSHSAGNYVRSVEETQKKDRSRPRTASSSRNVKEGHKPGLHQKAGSRRTNPNPSNIQTPHEAEVHELLRDRTFGGRRQEVERETTRAFPLGQYNEQQSLPPRPPTVDLRSPEAIVISDDSRDNSRPPSQDSVICINEVSKETQVQTPRALVPLRGAEMTHNVVIPLVVVPPGQHFQYLSGPLVNTMGSSRPEPGEEMTDTSGQLVVDPPGQHCPDQTGPGVNARDCPRQGPGYHGFVDLGGTGRGMVQSLQQMWDQSGYHGSHQGGPGGSGLLASTEPANVMEGFGEMSVPPEHCALDLSRPGLGEMGGGCGPLDSGRDAGDSVGHFRMPPAQPPRLVHGLRGPAMNAAGDRSRRLSDGEGDAANAVELFWQEWARQQQEHEALDLSRPAAVGGPRRASESERVVNAMIERCSLIPLPEVQHRMGLSGQGVGGTGDQPDQFPQGHSGPHPIGSGVGLPREDPLPPAWAKGGACGSDYDNAHQPSTSAVSGDVLYSLTLPSPSEGPNVAAVNVNLHNIVSACFSEEDSALSAEERQQLERHVLYVVDEVLSDNEKPLDLSKVKDRVQEKVGKEYKLYMGEFVSFENFIIPGIIERLMEKLREAFYENSSSSQRHI